METLARSVTADFYSFEAGIVKYPCHLPFVCLRIHFRVIRVLRFRVGLEFDLTDLTGGLAKLQQRQFLSLVRDRSAGRHVAPQLLLRLHSHTTVWFYE